MLKEPHVGGAAQLRGFVEELGFDRARQAVKVHPTTMRRWLREESEPPVGAVQALYWPAAHWRAPDRWAAANQADFDAPGLVVPLQQA